MSPQLQPLVARRDSGDDYLNDQGGADTMAGGSGDGSDLGDYLNGLAAVQADDHDPDLPNRPKSDPRSLR